MTYVVVWSSVGQLCVISGFRHEVAENCALLGCYAATETFHRPNSSLYKLPIGATGFILKFLNSEGGIDRLSRNVGKKLPLLAA